MTKPTLIWHRQDLRLHDNPALIWAAARHEPIIPVYIDDTRPENAWKPGAASQWWLHHALADLISLYKSKGIDLILQRGNPEKILHDLAKETNAAAVTWNRCYEPYAIARDTRIKSSLQNKELEVANHNGSLLVEPWDIKTGSGTPYKVYTPFSKACFALNFPQAASTPKKLNGVSGIASEHLADWDFLPRKPDWSRGFQKFWNPTSTGAEKRIADFLDECLSSYKPDRDRPDLSGTSRLSPYLHWGQISPREIWHRIHFTRDAHPEKSQGAETYLRELLWREFSYHLLFHFPNLPHKPFNPRFESFPWATDNATLRAWQKGQTGYPIVDAGMRELWQTGWMHNRVRMIVASFLIKDLMIPWQDGEAWFWDTLVDADLASNAASWQWVAGSGADAAPYFRIFNPTLQGKKFDPQGDYVRRYVPELAKLDAESIHEPWKADPAALAKAGVRLGTTYPNPIIDHAKARDRALKAYTRCSS